MYSLLEYWTEMFNYVGRSDRKQFWIGYLGNFVIIFAFYTIYAAVLGLVAGFNGGDDRTIETILFSMFILIYLVYWLAGLSARVRRLRDAGFNPWWILLSFIPIASLVVFVMLFFPTKQVKHSKMMDKLEQR